MKELTHMESGVHFLFVAAALVVIVTGINLAHAVLTPILISVFLSVLGTPPVLWLRKRHVPIGISVIIVLLVLVVAILSFGLVVGMSANTMLSHLPTYQAHLHEQIQVLILVLSSKGIAVSDVAFMKLIDADAMTNLMGSIMGGLSSAFSILIVVLLTVSFILLEASTFKQKIRVAVGNPRAAFPQFSVFISEMQRYMIYQTLIGLATGTAIGLWLWTLGVDFAVILGLLTFLLCYVPNVGSAITLVPTVAVAFIQFGAGKAVLVATGYLVITFVLGSIVQPRLIGRKLGLSTLVVFLSMVLWGNLLGPIGMVLCVPLTMALKFALEISDNTRWIGVLLERSPEEKTHHTPSTSVHKQRTSSVEL